MSIGNLKTMFDFAWTRIYPINEAAIDRMVEAAGGGRAHTDQDSRGKRGADYVIGNAVIELKILDDEGLTKPERQRKLAALFKSINPTKPVHVLDRELLNEAGKREYDRAFENPIKKAVRSAKGQLTESRLAHQYTELSILMIVNNGNTALNHEVIVRLACLRARNDTDHIDGLIVAGVYLHSDGMETIAIWPIDYIPIHVHSDFTAFAAFKKAFMEFAEETMTSMLVEPSKEMTKGPILDSMFELDGARFLKIAPSLGKRSDFFKNGRPRLNSMSTASWPPVGLVFPDLILAEWKKFRAHMPNEPSLGSSYNDWLNERMRASIQGTPLRPFVPISITFEDWAASLRGEETSDQTLRSMCIFATQIFNQNIQKIIAASREISESKILSSRFILVFTEQLGQDEANDVSEILLVEQSPNFDPKVTRLLRDVRIFHMYACALGAAYAIKHGANVLFWEKDTTYAWI